MSTVTKTYSQVAARSRRDELILRHLGMVRHVLGKLLAHLPQGVDVDNLESAGMLGLVEAAGKFDPERGIKFETFAFTRIRGAMLDELRRNCPLPQHVLEQVARVRKAYEESHPRASVELLAQRSGLTPDEVVDSLTAMRMTRMMSLDTSDSSENRFTDRVEQPYHRAEQEEERQLLTRALQSLPDRGRLVVTLYYLEDLRLREISRLLKLSESRVSQLLNIALFEIGEYLRARQGVD